MTKFNTSSHRARPAVAQASSPLSTSQGSPDTRTFEGAAAWKRSPKSDLFLQATSSFHGGEKTFYEDGDQRDETLCQLAAQVAVEDPAWFYEFLLWLRRTGNIRTAALMCAVAGVKARLDNPPTKPVPEFASGLKHWNRMFIDAVCQRPDEPGELLAYWTARYGRSIPKPVKRGLTDAVQRLYSGKALLKYDTASKGYRFGDVLNLVHAAPDPDKPWQGDLFQYALDRRHHPDTAEPPASSRTLNAHKELMGLPVVERRAVVLSAGGRERLAEAGMTWETLAGWLQGPMDKDAWEAIIPSMGYMALLRNLRNFDEAGVSNRVAHEIANKLAGEDEVRRSRQLPFRFYSAYKHAPSLRWASALETALDLSLSNIPRMVGRTLVLIDSSGSMQSPMSQKSTMQCYAAAGLFGAAVALKNRDDTDLYHFADRPEQIAVPKGGSVLRLLQHIESRNGAVGWGTEITGSVRQTYKGHDRVLIFSDGQTFGGGGYYRQSSLTDSVPENVPIYLFNLHATTASPMPTGKAARFDLGGLTDQTFQQIPQLEAGMAARWPWEDSDS